MPMSARKCRFPSRATARPSSQVARSAWRRSALLRVLGPDLWLANARSAATRYSELSEINAANVGQLRVAFTFMLGVNRGQEAAPLVVDNTMYVLSPYPIILFALDLTKPGPPVKWKYEPRVAPASQGVACCDVVNRGPVFA